MAGTQNDEKAGRRFFLSENAVLKWLETPAVYHLKTDELYELDPEAFSLLQKCRDSKGCGVADESFLRFCIDEGILVENGPVSRMSPLRQSPVPSLRYLELQITGRCNLSCSHCYLKGTDRTELGAGEIWKVLKEFEVMQGLRLLITGGEPLLHSDFGRINDFLPEFGFRKVLFTNGLLLDRRVLKNLNCDEIQISIDGIGASHDTIRGRGAYEKALAGLQSAREAGIPVSVSTMVHKGNLDDFGKMNDLFVEMSVRDWSVDVPCVPDNADLVPSPAIAGSYLNFGFGSGLHGGSGGYACGRHLMCVMPDGRAAKCGFYSDEPVGSISGGLETCWEKVRHYSLPELECDCEFLEACRGGCRYRAAIEAGGNVLARDIYRCAAFGKSV